MGLVDFMQQLQEQDSSIVYNEEPEQVIKVIPPEKSSIGIKIIPPEEEVVTASQPVKIKIKLKPKIQLNTTQQTVNKTEEPVVETKPMEKTPSTNEKASPKEQQQTVTRVEQPKESVENIEEQLFVKSGTEFSKKSIWLEYYQKAKSSRKQNIIVEKMRVGRFTITPDNKVLILPDYDVVNKDPDDILKDKWF